VQINRTRDISITADASPSSTRLTLLLFKSRNIWMLGLAGLFLGIVEFSAMAHLVLYLKERLLFSAIAAGGLLALTEGAGALGKPASGLASDRLFGGRRKLAFFLMASAAAAVCLVLASLGSSLGWLLYPVLAVLGGVAIGWGGLYATMAGELGGKEMAGVASGASAALINLGVLVGPPLFGYIVDNTGSYETAWLAMALSSSVAAVFIWLIREPQKHG